MRYLSLNTIAGIIVDVCLMFLQTHNRNVSFCYNNHRTGLEDIFGNIQTASLPVCRCYHNRFICASGETSFDANVSSCNKCCMKDD